MFKRFSNLIFYFTALLFLTSQASFAGGASAFTENSEDEFLHPDKAFQLDVVEIDQTSLEGVFKVAPGYYLYKDRVQFSIKNASQGKVSSVELPAGEIKDDPNFGKKEVYHHDFAAKVNLESASQGFVLTARYQGCSEQGLCYAPQTKTFTFGQPSTTSNSDASPAVSSTEPQSNEDQATSLLKSGKLWLIAAGFFGFGLLLSFTPCVLPMIPILSGIIVGDKKAHQHETSRLHSFNLSLAYVLGIALSYTLAGIAAGLSGQLLSNALQSPTMLTITALIFVVLSFSMFGFYELKMPHAIEDRMVNTTNKLKGGQFLGVFIMGIISALIVSPCVAAPLAGTLIYISQTKDVLLGGVALFSLSIGMGVPLLLIGASAGHVLPKAGNWMTAVRNAFGVLMLAVAIFIITPVLPISAVMMLWAALLIIPAIYLHALDTLPLDSETGRSHPWMRFWKGIGIILLILGIMMLIGAVTGAKTPLQPLSGLSFAGNSTQKMEHALPFKRIKNTAELDANIDNAKGQVIMLDFYADWCTSCKEMELFTFSDPSVQAALKDAVVLQADVTDNTAEDLALLKRFNLFGPPGIIFFNRSGQEIKTIRTIGYEDANQFLATVNRVNSLKADECNPAVTC